jgi:hypothetical protein
MTMMLPEWSVLESGDNPNLVKAERRLIITESWAASCHLLDVDVLIDARGANAAGFDGFPPRVTTTNNLVLLVDIADSGDRTLASNARHRCESYAERGWQLVS